MTAVVARPHRSSAVRCRARPPSFSPRCSARAPTAPDTRPPRYARRVPAPASLRLQHRHQRARRTLSLVLVVDVAEDVHRGDLRCKPFDVAREFAQFGFRILVIEALRRGGQRLAVPRGLVAPVEAYDGEGG